MRRFLIVCALAFAPTLAACGGVDPSKLDRQTLVANHLDGRRLEPLEGVWRSLRGDYEIGFYRADDKGRQPGRYVGVPFRLPAFGTPIGREAIWLDPAPQADVYIGNANFGLGRRTGVSVIFTAPHYFVFTFDDGRDRRVVGMLRVWPDGKGGEGSAAGGRGSGSGFLVGRGLVATNAHVVQDFAAARLTIAGRAYRGEVLRRDGAHDLAILRITGEQPAHACFDLSAPAEISSGERIYALGYPLSSELGSQEIRITEGLINALDAGDDDPVHFQMSAQIQPGNSGGPVVNAVGRVVGVTVAALRSDWLLKRGVVAQNVNFAVKRSYLDALLARLNPEPCARPIRPAARPMEPKDLVKRVGEALVFIETGGE